MGKKQQQLDEQKTRWPETYICKKQPLKLGVTEDLK